MAETDPDSLPAEASAAASQDRLAEPVDLEQPPRLPFAVVGIGASAGGLEACIDLFKATPADSGMAFVLVQHLPPDRDSLIAEILQRHTAMRVQQVEDAMGVEPNHVYVIRPGHTLTLRDGRFHLGDRLEKPRHSRPVDDFFRSLAEEQRERAICMIMSGMGSNGAAGAQAVKAVGGLCIAQDPDSAQFASMPRHLIDAGYADFILPPAEIPEVLLAYARHPYAADQRGAGNEDGAGDGPHDSQQREQQQVREILAVVRTRTRYDFSGYKKLTVLRRIQRRMGLNRLTDLGKYAKLLRQNALEVTGLADDLLIHVTGFFRDAEAWEALRERVIVPLVRARDAKGTIRCWVAACSSGEEAYSLAMLLVEESERAGKRLNIKVFATDTAERMLSSGRSGVYPGGIESEMPPERLQRFFDRDDAVYRVRQDLRERVMFAPQNVLSDPPFSQLDIVTCRNLLIYLEPEVQQRVFGLLHFGLRNGGALFLGNSETAPVGSGSFEPIDKKARIYKRIGPTRHGTVEFPLPRQVGREGSERHRPNTLAPIIAPSIAQLTARSLVAMHVPAAVTVDRNYHVVYYQGDTSAYLSQPSGEPTHDLLALANEQVRGALRTALQRTMASNAVETVRDGWTSNAAGRRCRVTVTASPLLCGQSSDLFVLSFQQHEEPEPQSSASDSAGEATDAGRFNEELQRLRDELQSVVEELQASIEEHKAAAEEAMSMNEELQSSNEELETSKEEMQSLNEELSTVNSQLHVKMDELQKTSGDLRSLLASTDIAVIFLDSQFRIRRYTPAARNLLELIGSDIGRPLSDLAPKFTDADLLPDAQSVLDRLVPAEREVQNDDGRWYIRRVLPYRTVDDRIEGVVITFVDISDRKRADALMLPAREAASADLKAMNSLHTASNLLIGAKDTLGVLQQILVGALDLHDTSFGEVQLYERATRTLRMVVSRGFSSEFLAAWPPVEAGSAAPSARAARERRIITIEDIELESPPSPFRELWLSANIRALQCVPLATSGGELVGVLSLQFTQPTQPDERSQRVTGLLARQGADTIERIRIDEERARLLRNEQLARRALDDAALMKDEFLATLSHELRTPLSAILLWGRMIRGAAIGSEQLNQGLDAILTSAEAQARLIEDLLDSSRSAAGKLQLDLGETDLVQVVGSVIEQNEPAARAKNLGIESFLSPNAGAVLADATRLRQVVWNLLINAVKFTPETGRIQIFLERADEEVTIRVSDTGIGIAADFLPNVFDRFRQYDASITRKQGGLGLGLAISKQLVEMHGGTIRAESAGINQGATFTVSLPLPVLRERHRRAKEHSQAAAFEPINAPLNGRTILLVEDDRVTQAALALVLEQAGAEVRTAATAEDALAAYRASPVQLLLSDIGLTDFDGYDLLGQIRAFEREHGLRAVPALALSAYARDTDRQKAKHAGFARHLAKPIDANQLVAELTALAGSD